MKVDGGIVLGKVLLEDVKLFGQSESLCLSTVGKKKKEEGMAQGVVEGERSMKRFGAYFEGGKRG